MTFEDFLVHGAKVGHLDLHAKVQTESVTHTYIGTIITFYGGYDGENRFMVKGNEMTYLPSEPPTKPTT